MEHGFSCLRAATPRAADIGVAVLRTLLEFGRLRGRVRTNVATGIPTLYRNGQRAEIIWTDEEIARFIATAERMQRPQIADGLRLAALIGLRRADLVTLTWSQVGEFAIQKLALKKSAGKRRRMTMPRIPALDALLIELRSRMRKPNVETVLVNSYGEPWSEDGFTGSFNRVRDAAGIVHEEEAGASKKKHLHDVRGTFCTKLITEVELTDSQAADIMGWAPERVGAIRRVYVDQARVVLALREKIESDVSTLGICKLRFLLAASFPRPVSFAYIQASGTCSPFSFLVADPASTPKEQLPGPRGHQRPRDGAAGCPCGRNGDVSPLGNIRKIGSQAPGT